MDRTTVWPRQPRWLRAALVALCLAAPTLLLVETWLLGGKTGSDYLVFYQAALRFRADPLSLYLDHSRESLVGFLYPPPAVLLFLPLTLASAEAAFGWTSAIIAGAAILALVQWQNTVRSAFALPADRVGAAALVMLALASGPVFTVRQGQIDTLILLLCCAAVWLDHRRWPRLAGALIAVGCWIKIYPVLMLFWIACRPQWRGLMAGFALAAVAVPLASLAVIPTEIYLDYFRTQLPAMSGRAIVNIYNQSLSGIFVRASASEVQYLTSFDALPIPAGVRAAITGGMLAAMAAITLRVRKSGAPAVLVAGWAMALACLAAPLGWGHTYCLALPLFVLAGQTALARIDGPVLVLLGACWLALLIPAYSQLPVAANLPGWLTEVFYARYALVTLVLLALGSRQAGRALPAPA